MESMIDWAYWYGVTFGLCFSWTVVSLLWVMNDERVRFGLPSAIILPSMFAWCIYTLVWLGSN